MAGIDGTDAQPASARQGASTATCAVLHRIYGAHRVHSLQGALLRIVQGVPALRDTLARTLAQPGDAAAYSEFLQQSLVVLPNPLPSLSPLATLEQSMTLSEAVMRTVNLLVQSGQENNVLRTGYRKKREGHSSFHPCLQHAEQWAPGKVPATALCEALEWAQLLARVGDSLLMHLLRYASVFTPLGQGNYLQVTGPGILEIAKAHNQARAHTNDPNSVNRASTHHTAQHAAQRPHARSQGPTQLTQHHTQQGTAQDAQQAPAGAKHKRVRPSSWQRRREAKRRAQAARDGAAADQTRGDTGEVNVASGGMRQARASCGVGQAHGLNGVGGGAVGRVVRNTEEAGSMSQDTCSTAATECLVPLSQQLAGQAMSQHTVDAAMSQRTEDGKPAAAAAGAVTPHAAASTRAQHTAAASAAAAAAPSQLQPAAIHRPHTQHTPSHPAGTQGTPRSLPCFDGWQPLSPGPSALLATQATFPLSPMPLWNMHAEGTQSESLSESSGLVCASECGMSEVSTEPELVPTQPCESVGTGTQQPTQPQEPTQQDGPTQADDVQQSTQPDNAGAAAAAPGPDAGTAQARTAAPGTDMASFGACGARSFGEQPQRQAHTNGVPLMRLAAHAVKTTHRGQTLGCPPLPRPAPKAANPMHAAPQGLTAPSAQQAKQAAPRKAGGGVPSELRRALSEVSHRALPRTGVLYAASFRSKPGLPAKHPLISHSPTMEAARTLVLSIFNSSPPSSATGPATGTDKQPDKPGQASAAAGSASAAAGPAAAAAALAAARPGSAAAPGAAGQRPPAPAAARQPLSAAAARSGAAGTAKTATAAAVAARTSSAAAAAAGAAGSGSMSAVPPSRVSARALVAREVPRRLERLIPLMYHALKRARSCLYHLLLNKHCPLPTATPHTQPHTQPHPPSHAHTDGHRETNQTHTQSGNARPAGAAGAAQQPSVLGRTPTGTQGAVSMSGGQAFAAPAPAFTAGTQGGGGVSVCVSQLRSQLEVAVESQAALMEGHLPQEQVAECLEAHADIDTAAGGSTGTHAAIRGLLAASCPHKGVGAFVWSVLRHILPPALLGNKHNQRLLLRRMYQVVSLRRHETLHTHHLASGLATSGFTWLHPTHTHPNTTKPSRTSTSTAPDRASQATTGKATTAHAARSQKNMQNSAQALALQGRSKQHKSGVAVSHGVSGRAEHGVSGISVKGVSESVQHGGVSVCTNGHARVVGRKPAQRATPCVHQQRVLDMLTWVQWLFAHLVLPLLRAHFYITETEPYKNQVFYYRKPVWARLQASAMRELLSSRFTPITQQQAYQRLSQRELGLAKLRLLPKTWGLRPIVNMGTNTTAVFRLPGRTGPGANIDTKPGSGTKKRKAPAQFVRLNFKSTNNVLQNVHQALKAEVADRPSLKGGSVWGYEDILRALYPFIAALRKADTQQKVYIVSADVARAFDSLDIDRLMQLIDKVLVHPNYHVVRYGEVTPALRGDMVRVRHQRAAHLCDTRAAPGLAQWLRHTASQGLGSYSTVFVDQVPHLSMTLPQGIKQVKEAMSQNIVLMGSRWFRQSRGIPQGATVSSLLCSLYLADMEAATLRPLLPGLTPPHNPATAATAAAAAAAAAQQRRRARRTHTAATGAQPARTQPSQPASRKRAHAGSELGTGQVPGNTKRAAVGAQGLETHCAPQYVPQSCVEHPIQQGAPTGLGLAAPQGFGPGYGTAAHGAGVMPAHMARPAGVVGHGAGFGLARGTSGPAAMGGQVQGPVPVSARHLYGPGPGLHMAGTGAAGHAQTPVPAHLPGLGPARDMAGPAEGLGHMEGPMLPVSSHEPVSPLATGTTLGSGGPGLTALADALSAGIAVTGVSAGVAHTGVSAGTGATPVPMAAAPGFTAGVANVVPVGSGDTPGAAAIRLAAHAGTGTTPAPAAVAIAQAAAPHIAGLSQDGYRTPGQWCAGVPAPSRPVQTPAEHQERPLHIAEEQARAQQGGGMQTPAAPEQGLMVHEDHVRETGRVGLADGGGGPLHIAEEQAHGQEGDGRVEPMSPAAAADSPAVALPTQPGSVQGSHGGSALHTPWGSQGAALQAQAAALRPGLSDAPVGAALQIAAFCSQALAQPAAQVAAAGGDQPMHDNTHNNTQTQSQPHPCSNNPTQNPEQQDGPSMQHMQDQPASMQGAGVAVSMQEAVQPASMQLDIDRQQQGLTGAEQLGHVSQGNDPMCTPAWFGSGSFVVMMSQTSSGYPGSSQRVATSSEHSPLFFTLGLSHPQRPAHTNNTQPDADTPRHGLIATAAAGAAAAGPGSAGPAAATWPAAGEAAVPAAAAAAAGVRTQEDVVAFGSEEGTTQAVRAAAAASGQLWPPTTGPPLQLAQVPPRTDSTGVRGPTSQTHGQQGSLDVSGAAATPVLFPGYGTAGAEQCTPLLLTVPLPQLQDAGPSAAQGADTAAAAAAAAAGPAAAMGGKLGSQTGTPVPATAALQPAAAHIPSTPATYATLALTSALPAVGHTYELQHAHTLPTQPMQLDLDPSHAASDGAAQPAARAAGCAPATGAAAPAATAACTAARAAAAEPVSAGAGCGPASTASSQQASDPFRLPLMPLALNSQAGSQGAAHQPHQSQSPHVGATKSQDTHTPQPTQGVVATLGLEHGTGQQPLPTQAMTQAAGTLSVHAAGTAPVPVPGFGATATVPHAAGAHSGAAALPMTAPGHSQPATMLPPTAHVELPADAALPCLSPLLQTVAIQTQHTIGVPTLAEGGSTGQLGAPVLAHDGAGGILPQGVLPQGTLQGGNEGDKGMQGGNEGLQGGDEGMQIAIALSPRDDQTLPPTQDCPGPTQEHDNPADAQELPPTQGSQDPVYGSDTQPILIQLAHTPQQQDTAVAATEPPVPLSPGQTAAQAQPGADQKPHTVMKDTEGLTRNGGQLPPQQLQEGADKPPPVQQAAANAVQPVPQSHAGAEAAAIGAGRSTEREPGADVRGTGVGCEHGMEQGGQGADKAPAGVDGVGVRASGGQGGDSVQTGVAGSQGVAGQRVWVSSRRRRLQLRAARSQGQEQPQQPQPQPQPQPQQRDQPQQQPQPQQATDHAAQAAVHPTPTPLAAHHWLNTRSTRRGMYTRRIDGHNTGTQSAYAGGKGSVQSAAPVPQDAAQPERYVGHAAGVGGDASGGLGGGSTCAGQGERAGQAACTAPSAGVKRKANEPHQDTGVPKRACRNTHTDTDQPQPQPQPQPAVQLRPAPQPAPKPAVQPQPDLAMHPGMRDTLRPRGAAVLRGCTRHTRRSPVDRALRRHRAQHYTGNAPTYTHNVMTRPASQRGSVGATQGMHSAGRHVRRVEVRAHKGKAGAAEQGNEQLGVTVGAKRPRAAVCSDAGASGGSGPSKRAAAAAAPAGGATGATAAAGNGSSGPAGRGRAAARAAAAAAAQPASLLLRLVDDFLLLTTSRPAAEAAALRLLQGFPEYGCKVNPLKTQASFPLHTTHPLTQVTDAAQGAGGESAERVWLSPCGGRFVRWCGLLIDIHTLELRADYSRLRGVHLSATLSLPCTPHPGRQLPLRVAAFMRPKCHALLLDSTINTHTTVCLNLYQAFILSAMKMHCYLRALTARKSLPHTHAHPNTNTTKHPSASLVLKTIKLTLSYCVRLSRSRLSAASARFGFPLVCGVSDVQIRWLGLRAFLTVLTRKQSSYPHTLMVLSRELRRPVYTQVAEELTPAVAPQLSAVFDQIEF